jgi:hypothetical protein
MVFPFKKGTPPETTLTGFPQVWASMQEKVWREGIEVIIKLNYFKIGKFS